MPLHSTVKELRGPCGAAKPFAFCRHGGDDRDRTDDLRLAKPALSQLSYIPGVSRQPAPAWWA